MPCFRYSASSVGLSLTKARLFIRVTKLSLSYWLFYDILTNCSSSSILPRSSSKNNYFDGLTIILLTLCWLLWTYSVRGFREPAPCAMALRNLLPLLLYLCLLPTYAVPGLRSFDLRCDLLSGLYSFHEGDETSRLVMENFWKFRLF